MSITDDHSNIVAAVKAALEARGFVLNNPCGAFEITKRVAWMLRAEGAGLLSKTTGNNCDGHAVDIVVYPDGRYADVLGDAGNANTPAWNVAQGVVDLARYLPAIDPGDVEPTPGPTPTPTPTPPAEPHPFDELAAQLLADFDRIADGLEGLAVGVAELVNLLKALQANGVKLKL